MLLSFCLWRVLCEKTGRMLFRLYGVTEAEGKVHGGAAFSQSTLLLVL